MMPDPPHPADKDQPAEGGRGPGTNRSTADDSGKAAANSGKAAANSGEAAANSGKVTPSPEQAERNREEDPPA